TETTHLLENLLDGIRRGEMTLRADMIDIFLETKDVLNGQLDTYRNDAEPAPETYARICEILKQLAQEQKESAGAALVAPAPAVPIPVPAAAASVPVEVADDAATAPGKSEGTMKIVLSGVAQKDQRAILDEIANLGRITAQTEKSNTITLWVDTTCSAD